MSPKSFIYSVSFVRILLPIIAGIFVFHFLSHLWDCSNNWFLLVLAILIALFLLYYHCRKTSRSFVFGITLNVFLLISGFLIFSTHESNTIIYPEIGKYTVVAKVEHKRILSEGRSIIVIKTLQAENSIKSYKASLFWQHDDPEVIPGAVVLIRATCNTVKNKGNPGEYDFASYLRRQHITTNGFVQSVEILEVRKDYFHIVWVLKERLKKLYQNAGFRPENAALLYALTSGDKSLISDEQKEAFKNSGVIHILAVSGLHVGIMYMMIFALLKPLSKRKYGRFVSFFVILVILMIYALFTGLSPSVTRAVIMFILIDLTRLLRKPHLIYNVIAISAFIIVIADPHYLFEPGLWLSYGAVLSILLIMNLAAPYLREKPKVLKRIFEVALVTIAAQPGTLPLVLFWFKQFPKYFLVTNLFVIPFIGIALIYNFVIIILGIFGVPLEFISKPLDWLITFINLVPEMVSGLNDAVFSGINISFEMVLLLYSIFIVLITMMYRQNLKLLKHVSVLGIALILFSGFSGYKSEKRREVVVFNSSSIIIAERAGKTCIFYTPTMDEPDQCTTDYVNDTGIQGSYAERLKNFQYAGGELFQLVSDRKDRLMELPVKRYLLLEAFPYNLSVAKPYIKQCIILRSCNYYDTEKIVDWCDKNNISYYDIKQKGAFLKTLASY
ncbi:ComEC/Rec2 family competence protein [Saccharicrinis sp. FJH2]|uniref:ComEC/Rec2 family competence protein n=1 Tax=Saccharicrinis sp. FJH65 TaxID=3344659 RepID=UPI0035F30708